MMIWPLNREISKQPIIFAASANFSAIKACNDRARKEPARGWIAQNPFDERVQENIVKQRMSFFHRVVHTLVVFFVVAHILWVRVSALRSSRERTRLPSRPARVASTPRRVLRL